MSVLVSVIVPNYNGARLLPLCLDSLRRQTHRPLEVLVVDNGSADGSRELVEGSYPEVRFLPLGENRGFSAAVNAGIAASRGAFVALLNNDAAADPRWLEELVARMEGRPSLGVAACKVLLYFQREVIDSAGVVLYRDGVTWNRGHGEPDRGQYDREEPVFGGTGAAVLYRREMLEAIALEGEVFDEDFVSYYEDADVSLRSHLAGFGCLYVPASRVYHVGSATGRRTRIRDGRPVLEEAVEIEAVRPIAADDYIFYYSSTNYWNFLIKNLPLRLLLRVLGGALLYEAVRFLGSSLRHRTFGSYLAARARLARQLPLMLRKRRQVLAGRRVDEEYLAGLFTPRPPGFYFEAVKRGLGGIRRGRPPGGGEGAAGSADEGGG